jgi:Cupin domain
MLAPAPEVAFTLKTGTDETNGAWTLFEYRVPAPLRRPAAALAQDDRQGLLHPRGHSRFEVDGETTDVGAGGYARVPPGVVHRFSNPTDEAARFLGICHPRRLRTVLRGAR